MTGHQPVLLNECIEGLVIKPDGVYIDGTFGRGGHSKALIEQLGQSGRLIAIDKDNEALSYAKQHFEHDERFEIFQGSFANIRDFAKRADVLGQVDGVLLDLGVSSPQLDNAERGFSFVHDGPLDMRMDHTQSYSAFDFVNNASIEHMTQTFREYGEEKFSGRIARAIARFREEKNITTTGTLAEIIKDANPRWEKHKHPATRVFQAIRIEVNQELNDLKKCLDDCLDVLKIGGRLVVISFHSLEDRVVKQFMRQMERGPQLPKNIPIKASDLMTNFKRIGKAIKPSDVEVYDNVRARSAVLRIGEKIS